MVVFLLLVCAMVVVGTAVAHALWRRLDPAGVADTHPVEFVAAGALLGLAIWLGLNWALALTHLLNRPALWTCVAVILGAATLIILRRARTLASVEIPSRATPALIALTPLFLWTIFILWRGSVLPADNHDALSYHLPKALLMMRAEGYETFPAPDPRITTYPFNYELLLADVLILAGNETLTEWVGTATFLALLLTTAALSQRWWSGRIMETTAVVLATASAPVLLLHAGADKNDLMTVWLATSALLWGARWVVSGGRLPMLLTTLALGLAFGTKATAAPVGLALAPFLAYRTIRELRRRTISMREIGLTAAAAILTFLLGGGASYILNSLNAPGATAAASATPSALHVAYGDWSNLWQVPYLLLTVPFSTTDGVWVPWRGERWFWPKYEIFFSHYGRLLTILAVILPFIAIRLRRAGAFRERTVASLAALLAVAIMLPTQLRPLGFFGAFARYFAFIVPMIACWTLPPIVTAAAAQSRRLVPILLAAFALIFSAEAVDCAINDRFSPLRYALLARDYPGTRVIWFYPLRAASVVDRVAGPHDKIAVDGGFDTWVWPAYGRALTRDVEFLPQPAASPSDIPGDARWVIIDRSWSALWNHPGMTNLGQMSKYIGRGTPTPDDIHLYNALLRDPRFRLVYRNQRMNQAVFRRIEPQAAVPRSGTMRQP